MASERERSESLSDASKKDWLSNHNVPSAPMRSMNHHVGQPKSEAGGDFEVTIDYARAFRYALSIMLLVAVPPETPDFSKPTLR
jgi:hypothetical protein